MYKVRLEMFSAEKREAFTKLGLLVAFGV